MSAAEVEPEAPFNPKRPFTRADAIAAGVSPKMLRGSRYRRIFRGVYVDAATPDTPLLRAEAALALFSDRDAHASHLSAGRIHGVPLPIDGEEHVTLLDKRRRPECAGIRIHRATQAAVVTRGRVRVSTPLQMFVELGAVLSLVDVVIVGDNLVRHDKVTLQELRDFCATSTTPGVALARRAADLVRARVDSPMETRLRLLIVFAGLPEPRVNLTLRTEYGDVSRRYDLSYPEIRVIVEYDGRQHAESIEQWESDLTRREEIDDSGWRILVVTSNGIYKHPAQTVLRVWRLLRARRLPAVPARPGDGWRPHFTGR